MFMDNSRKVYMKNSYEHIRKLLDSGLQSRASALIDKMNQKLGLQEIDPWKDFTDNTSLYYTILEDTVSDIAVHKQKAQRADSLNNGERKLFCPYDGQKLRNINSRNSDGAKGKKRTDQLYGCAYCGREFISLQARPDLSKVIMNGKQYTNLRTDKAVLAGRPKIKLSPYEGDSLSVKENYTKPECYIAVSAVAKCRNCGCNLIGAQLSIYNSYAHEMVKPAKYCPSCGTFYITDTIVKHCREIFDIKNLDKFSKYIDAQQKQNFESAEEDVQIIDFKDFVVRQNTFSCYYKNHYVEEIAALINVMDRSGNIWQRKVTAGYCATCRTYFILESTFQKLKNTGTILCRVSDEKTYIADYKNIFSGKQLAPESILKQYGYNVSQQENLSKEQRWKILEMILDNGICPKPKMISLLDYHIRMREKQNTNMYDVAISKWETDRDHIENYRIDSKRKVSVKSIRRK